MAGRAGPPAGAGQQYSLPKFSAEEQWVQKKQGEFIQGDVRMLSSIDVEKPFQSVQDAVQRLLPFHLFGAVDAADADVDDTPDCGGADLMSNRHEAWQELCISKANELRKRADNSAAQIAALKKQTEAEALSGSRPLDRLAMLKLQQEDLKRKVAAEKAALQLASPPVVVAQQQQLHQQQQQQAVMAAATKSSVGGGMAAQPAVAQVNPAAGQMNMQQRLLLQQQLLVQQQLQQQAATQAAQHAAQHNMTPTQQQELQRQLFVQYVQRHQQQQQQQYTAILMQQQQQQLLQQQAKK